MTLLDIGYIVVTCYNMAVVQLVLPERGICEIYFSIWGAPPLNPHSNILRLDLIPNHFLHVYLKDDCPLPPTCGEWKNHKIGEAKQLEFAFMDRQALFKDHMLPIHNSYHQGTNVFDEMWLLQCYIFNTNFGSYFFQSHNP